MFQLLKHGYIRKLVSNLKDSYLLVTEISFRFEIAAKFLYGFNFELSTKNIFMVRCVSEFLEMTEEYVVRNLVTRSEANL